MDKKLSRYSLTAYNRQCRVEAAILDVFGRAKSFHFTHDQLLDAMGKVRNSHDYKKLTGYQLGRATMLNERCQADLYNHHLEWRVSLDGKLIPGKEVPGGRWSDVDANKGAHVWSDKPECVFHGGRE